MAGREEAEHRGRVPGAEEVDHAGVELQAPDRGHADSVDAVRHQVPVHHPAADTLVAVEIELLQRREEKVGEGLLERVSDAALDGLNALRMDADLDRVVEPCGRRSTP